MRYVTYKCRDCGYIYRVLKAGPTKSVMCPLCGSTKKDHAAWKDRVGKNVMPDEAQNPEI